MKQIKNKMGVAKRNNFNLNKKRMKKVIFILLLMFVDVQLFLVDGYGFDNIRKNETSDASLINFDALTTNRKREAIYSSGVEKNITIKCLTESYDLVKVMENLHQDIVIDKILLSTYKNKIAFFETGNAKNPYQVKNKFGYVGKYQFGSPALKTLYNADLINYNVCELGKDVFLCDSIAQESAMDALVVYNMEFLKKKNLYHYLGKKIRGITITAEGMLAGAHLVGPAAVSHYIKNNGSLEDFYIKDKLIRKYDGSGVSVEDYIKIFSHI
ncbi:MAG: hypothetical protein HC836_15780 [Richelia sp. RM2_1_2]|nr:hypothetical protein [Richelia sp. RM2_1_2]